MVENYIQNAPGDGAVPGSLGLGQSRATMIFNAFYLFYYLVPIPVALVSDAWLGRYAVLCISLRCVLPCHGTCKWPIYSHNIACISVARSYSL